MCKVNGCNVRELSGDQVEVLGSEEVLVGIRGTAFWRDPISINGTSSGRYPGG